MLILRLKFNNSSISDITGENVGVFSSSDSTHGDVAYFNGNSYIKVQPQFYGDSPRSISYWVKRLNTDPCVITSIGFDSERYSTFFGLGNKDLVINYGKDSLYVTGNFPSLKWFNIVSTYDGINLKIYVDGVLHGYLKTNLNTYNGDFIIGSDPKIDIDFSLNGYMLDLRVYDEPIGSKYIKRMYKDGPNPFSIIMYSNAALLEWNRIYTYNIIIKNNNGKILKNLNVKGTLVNVYDLDEDEFYIFEVYDLDKNLVYKKRMKTSPIIDDEVKNLINFVSNDLTKIKKKNVSKISSFLRNNLNTNDTVKARVEFKNRLQKGNMKFVKDSESLSVSDSSIILMPFLLGGSSSQNVEFKMDDLTTEKISYDELENTVSVNSKKYSVGDQFILNGKLVKVSELN